MFLCFIGCAAPQGLRHRSEVLDPATIEAVLRRAPVAPDQPFRAETLLISEEFSAHLLQFSTAEQRHIHREHDLTFIAQRGAGEVYINDRKRPVRPGDVFHIPRGTPHYCVNTGPEPLVAVLIFTPPFDLKDSIPVPRDSKSYPREPE